MDEKKIKRDRFNWRLPFYAAAGALIIFLPLILYSFDLGEILYIVVVTPIISLTLLVIALCKRGRSGLVVLSMLVVYWAVSWGLIKNSLELCSTARWIFKSTAYKAEVMTQPNAANRELKHIEWDGWGFPGAGDTVVYLVYDPSDSLSAAAKSHSSGKFSGIPCEVSRVRRLESHYYSVLFYTETNWDGCK